MYYIVEPLVNLGKFFLPVPIILPSEASFIRTPSQMWSLVCPLSYLLISVDTNPNGKTPKWMIKIRDPATGMFSPLTRFSPF